MCAEAVGHSDQNRAATKHIHDTNFLCAEDLHARLSKGSGKPVGVLQVSILWTKNYSARQLQVTKSFECFLLGISLMSSRTNKDDPVGDLEQTAGPVEADRSPTGLEKTTISAPEFDLFVNLDCCFS